MKNQGSTASIGFPSPTGDSSVQVYHDYQKVAFKMNPGNGHVVDGDPSRRREQLCYREEADNMSPVLNSHRSSPWMLDSSSQAYSGPEDSTDAQETMTETSTLTYMEGNIMEDSGQNSLQGVEMIQLKEFVLIDDDDDGDMSLREKTVIDLTVADRRAAELVCGRLLSTSSGSMSECKEEALSPELSPVEEREPLATSQRCCSCCIL
ncbi:uncharacterized protein ACB058_006727 [Synchiropus picturatus]